MPRILGQPRYPNSPGAPAVVAPLVAALIRHPRHCFWPDAVHHGGQLVTLDQRLNSAAVVGGSEALRLIEL